MQKILVLINDQLNHSFQGLEEETRCYEFVKLLVQPGKDPPSALGGYMILSFELPFALIPLLKFSSSSPKMGPHKNSIIIIVISWILGVGIIGINVYYLSIGLVNSQHSKSGKHTQNDPQVPTHMELGPIAFREDLRDIQLPH
ncbi:hypothetical protein K1719_017833 [Acacia pycnantha]|nr:hypothetical protein K1719_017833 [Acacia pycnantha]